MQFSFYQIPDSDQQRQLKNEILKKRMTFNKKETDPLQSTLTDLVIKACGCKTFISNVYLIKMPFLVPPNR